MQIPKRKKHWPPDKRYHRNLNTIYLNFDEFGATLFIFQAHPTPRCLQEFEKKFEMRFTEFYGKIILTFRFGTLDWFYIPYTPYYDIYPDGKLYFPDCSFGINLFIFLIESTSMKLLKIRTWDLPIRFSKRFQSAVRFQALRPYNREKHFKIIKALYSNYSAEEIAFMSKLQHRCKIRYHKNQQIDIFEFIKHDF